MGTIYETTEERTRKGEEREAMEKAAKPRTDDKKTAQPTSGQADARTEIHRKTHDATVSTHVKAHNSPASTKKRLRQRNHSAPIFGELELCISLER